MNRYTKKIKNIRKRYSAEIGYGKKVGKKIGKLAVKRGQIVARNLREDYKIAPSYGLNRVKTSDLFY